MKALRQFGDGVPVTHPAGGLGGKAGEKAIVFFYGEFGKAVFSFGGAGNGPSQYVNHVLQTVADPQNGYAEIEDGGIDFRAARLIDAGGAAGQDDTLGIQGLDLFAGDRGRFDLAVHPALPHASGNELIELGTEINDQDHVYL